MDRLKKISWWFWFFTEILIGIGIFYTPKVFIWAICLVLLQIAYFTAVDKKLVTFTVQVRLAFALILTAGQIPGFEWIYWIPFIGVAVMLLTGYCFLARCLSLLPGIRRVPLTKDLLKHTFLTPPVKGSILKGQTS